ncbi:MAG: glycoside hydrolase family 2 TIM barrel-domain containing protein [Verrucomicrobiia bacterium]
MKTTSFLGLAVILFSTTPTFGGDGRERPFDANWRFLRADATGAERPDFNDTAWRTLDVPHDWSIEDLPPVDPSVPRLSVVPGQWRFHEGDDAVWKVPELNDGDWQEVTLPDTWEHHSNYTNDNVYGWFRRHIDVPAGDQGKDIELLLGKIDDTDEAYFNGVRIGGTGLFPPDFQTGFDIQRRYRIPASLVHGGGTDVLAVRVFDAHGSGGIYTAGVQAQPAGPFDPGSSDGGPSTGHVLGGTGWYRKHFTLGQGDSNQLVSVRFDGVYMNSDVWINGRHLGIHPYGYTSFAYDLTPWLKPAGQENVLAVRVRNEGRNSRWYSGSGIFRHVWLTVTEPVHVPLWGVQVTTPKVSKEIATVQVTTEIQNGSGANSNVMVRTLLFGPGGKVVKSVETPALLPAGGTNRTEQIFEVSSPKLWSPDTPDLYWANVAILCDGKLVDQVPTTFGIRQIEVDAEHGFRLNGQMIKLKGGCMHHDNGPLGSATIDRAEERRIELMKANGFNAIRTSHNPPSPAFLDACDRLGMLVIDEAFDQWEQPKNGQDYHLYFKDWSDRDLTSMVRRDRNHPAVVIWSIGNEIPERFKREDIARQLRGVVSAQDNTRPITAAICADWDSGNRNWDKTSDSAFKNLDIGGYNYLPDKYESDHARNPQRVMVATESYPKDLFDYWSLVEKHSYVIGDFVWTGMDYLGESGIGHAVLNNVRNEFLMPWPWFDAYCGDIDTCGFKKPQSYYRDVVWGRSQIEMEVHAPMPPGFHEIVSAWGWPDECQSWNWPGQEDKPLQVAVYSRCDTVRLELNGKIIGEKPVSATTKLTAKFEVPYVPGELRASGLNNGKVVATTVLRTAGAPAKLRLTADRETIRNDRNDLSYVTVEVLDQDGNRVPNAVIPVHFSVSGAGELAAQGSSSPNDVASFHAPMRKTFQGRCLAILRPKGGAGTITLRAQADGLVADVITIQTR